MKGLKILSKKNPDNGASQPSTPSLLENFFESSLPSLFGGPSQWLDRWFRNPTSWSAMPGLRTPAVDVSEDDKEVTVKAEVPGLSEKDLDLSYSDGILYLKGEKREEKEEKNRNTWHRETWQGSFTRAVPLGERVDWKKAQARYKEGVLTVTFPKVPGKENRVKINIQ